MKMLIRAALALSAAALCAPVTAQPPLDQPSGYPLLQGSPTGNERVPVILPNGTGRVVLFSTIQGLAGGGSASTPLNVSAIGRDSAGRVNAFTSSGTAYTVTYDSFGPATIAGGGKTTTVTRNAQGAVTGISTQ